MICGRSFSSSWMKLIPHVAVTTGGGHAAYSADWPCSSCAVPRSACRSSHDPQGCRRDVERVQTREDSLPPAAMERSEARGRVKRVELDCDGVTKALHSIAFLVLSVAPQNTFLSLERLERDEVTTDFPADKHNSRLAAL
ncbi:unnamed protein product, partial [Ectocarpus sp. 12 AP-2014]